MRTLLAVVSGKAGSQSLRLQVHDLRALNMLEPECSSPQVSNDDALLCTL
jgi:hypothetical protein